MRAKQARHLADRASVFDRSIVLGDLNATPDARELTPLWKLFRDADLQWDRSRVLGTSHIA